MARRCHAPLLTVLVVIVALYCHASSPHHPLPPHWVQVPAPDGSSGAVYYYNQQTGHTQWHHPAAEAAAPADSWAAINDGPSATWPGQPRRNPDGSQDPADLSDDEGGAGGGWYDDPHRSNPVSSGGTGGGGSRRKAALQSALTSFKSSLSSLKGGLPALKGLQKWPNIKALLPAQQRGRGDSPAYDGPRGHHGPSAGVLDEWGEYGGAGEGEAEQQYPPRASSSSVSGLVSSEVDGDPWAGWVV